LILCAVLYGGHCARSAYEGYAQHERNAHAVRALRLGAWAKIAGEAYSAFSALQAIFAHPTRLRSRTATTADNL
jgi:hypothetical protein